MKKDGHGVRTARDSIIYTVGQVTASVAVLAALIVFARLLRPQLFGIYSIVMAFYTLLALIGGFAIGATVRKKMPERKGRAQARLISSAYSIGLTISFAVALTGVLASGYLSANVYHQNIMPLIVFASLLTVFWMLFNLTTSVLVTAGKVVEATIIDFVYSFAFLGFGALFVALGYGVEGAISGLAIGIALGTLLGVYYLPMKRELFRTRPAAKDVKEIVSFSAPVFISNMMQRGINNFSVLFLAAFVGAALVGNYNIAFQIGSFVTIIITSFTFVLLPAFSRLTARKSGKGAIASALDRSTHMTAVFLAPCVAFVAAAAKPLIYLLFSSSYPYAPLFTVLISAGAAVGILWSYANTLMIGAGDIRSFIKYQIAAAAIEVAAILVLTPIFHAIGMVVGLFVVSQLAIDALYIYAMHRKFGFVPQTRKPIMAALAAAVVFAVMALVNIAVNAGYAAIFIDLVGVVVIYPPLLALIRGISKADLEFIRRTAGRFGSIAPVRYFMAYAERFAR